MARRLLKLFAADAIDARIYAALRIAFGFFAFGTLVSLLPQADFYYSDEGWFPAQAAMQMAHKLQWSLLFNIESSTASTLFFIGGSIIALAMTLGLFSHVTTALTFLFITSVQIRNMGVVYGGDDVLRLILFYLCFAPTGKTWSLDQKFFTKKTDTPPRAAGWVMALIQVQVCIIYCDSGLIKLHGRDWVHGAALSRTLANPTFARFDLHFLMHLPFITALITLGTWMTLVWEISFPVLVLNKKTRWLALAVGLMIHSGIILLMKVHWFGYLMIATYIAFLPSHIFDKVEFQFHQIIQILKVQRAKIEKQNAVA